jgi:hypothetical protein
MSFDLGDLIEASLMAAALECRAQPQGQDFVGKSSADDPAAHREHVRVVVLTGQPRGEQIVAERCAHALDFVRRDLLPLAAAAEDDAAIRAARRDEPADVGADRRIVHRILGVRPTILDLVTEPLERRNQMLFERKAGVVRSDRDAHGRR